MHRAFISYHHRNDQWAKDFLTDYAERHQLFHNWSVDIGEIDPNLDDQTIRQKIRDEYLRDSTVTILLVGLETKERKHIDWEIYSSMVDGQKNKKSGIIVVNLPSTGCSSFHAVHDGEKALLYPNVSNWITISERAEFERRYEYVPPRIIDSLLKPGSRISVVNWDLLVSDPEFLRFLVNSAAAFRARCEYDLSRPMKRINAPRRSSRPARPMSA